MAVKILIADDHPLIANGIKNIFEENGELQVVKVVSNGKEVISYLEENSVDLILLDIEMPVMNGIDCVEILLSRKSSAKIVMLSMHEDPFLVKKVMNLGVSSYLLKTTPPKEFLFAIDKIVSGGNYFNAEVTHALLNHNVNFTSNAFQKGSPLLNILTKREKEIIRYVCLGLTNIEIGEKLFVSHKTVSTHRTNIMRKLEIHNVVSLVRFAIKNGLS